MEIIEVDCNDQYKVLSVSLNAGEKIPFHHATSDALLIGRKGTGDLTFADRCITLSAGESLLIKAYESHRLDIREDFSTYLVLDLNGVIKFSNPIP